MSYQIVMVTPSGMTEKFFVEHVPPDSLEIAIAELKSGKLAWVRPETLAELEKRMGWKDGGNGTAL